jgi:hypothetical protein
MTEPEELSTEEHSAAEDLDEDQLRVDPLEEGMDPPEHWSPAIDQDDPHDLDERLSEEAPDTAPPPEPRDEIERMAADGELEGHLEDDPFDQDRGGDELRTPHPPA